MQAFSTQRVDRGQTRWVALKHRLLETHQHDDKDRPLANCPGPKVNTSHSKSNIILSQYSVKTLYTSEKQICEIYINHQYNQPTPVIILFSMSRAKK